MNPTPSRSTVLVVLSALLALAVVAVVLMWALRDEPGDARRADGPLPQEPGTLLEAEPVVVAPAPAPEPAPEPQGNPWWWWLVGAATLVALVALVVVLAVR